MGFFIKPQKIFPRKVSSHIGRDPPGARKIQEVKKTFKSTADHLPVGCLCRENRCTGGGCGGIFGPMGSFVNKIPWVRCCFSAIYKKPPNLKVSAWYTHTHTPKLQVFAYYISSVGRFSVKPIPAPPVRACVECTDVAVASKQQRAHAKLNFAGENRQTCGALNVFSKIQVDSDND